MIRYEDIIGEHKDKASEFALAKFISEVDTVNTSIGDIRDGFRGGPKYLMVTGVMIGKGESDFSDILQDSNITMDMTDKFRDVGDRTSIMMMRDYINNFSCENGDELLAKLRAIIKNKKLIMPIKVGMPCQVIVETEDGTRLVKKNTTVSTLKWSVNRETSLMECLVVTEPVETLISKQLKVNITEYGKRLFLTDIERTYRESEKSIEDVIEMTRHGFMKPVKFKSKNMNILIDNSFMYCDRTGRMVPVAYWGPKDTLCGDAEFKEISKTKEYKEVKKYLTYIEKHRRYIGPGIITEAKEIEI